MIVIVIVICVLVLGGYYLVVYNDSIGRAEMSVKEYLQDPEYFLNSRSNNLYFTFELYTYEEPDPEMYYDSTEVKLMDYYMSDPSRFIYGNIYHFGSGFSYAVFMPMDNVVWPDEYREFNYENQDSLVYCDLSYDFYELRGNIMVFVIIVAAVLVLIFLVSRYTVKMLDAKDESMKNFFANASHELKTPLMSIRGNVDGIREGYVGVEAGCEVIEKETERMSRLVGDILEISRVDSGSLEPQMLDCDVREIVYDAASSVMQTAEQKGIRLDVDIPEPVFRKCDESMLYSAFSNILTNAVRYAESFIRVSSEPAKEKVVFTFENDGEPISDEDRQHIFDRFYKGVKGQTGIGMALAREYVVLHGSDISLEVSNGHTVFKIPL